MNRSRLPARIRRWLAGVAVLALVGAIGLVPAASATENEPPNIVLTWNQNAINVISQTATPPVMDPPIPPGLGQGPPLAALNLAMVHGAIYDAVNAIEGGYEPYLPGLSRSPNASKAAAVAQAAADVLSGVTAPTNEGVQSRIQGMLDASLGAITDTPAKTAGIELGADAADVMLAARFGDGRADAEPFLPTLTNEVGVWRLVTGPPAANQNVAGQFATVAPLTLNSPDQYETAGMPPLTSRKYAREFREVKRLGAQVGSTRTEAQTLMAGFYTANPILFYNAGLRDIATRKGLSTSEQARLFVKTSMAGADALISCWHNKKLWNAWRPQTAIREAANDGNPRTSPDPNWLSLFGTPGYPDEPSGYNCYTGGFWHSARYFFGTDEYGFSLSSPGVLANAGAGNPVGVGASVRSYTRFTDVVNETIEGRILNGFHFRTADVHGAWLGKKAAQWINDNYFGPVD